MARNVFAAFRRLVAVPVSSHPARTFWVLAAAWLALDQLVKVAQRALMETGDSIPLIEGVFHLTSHQNTGAAFSMLQGHAEVLAVFALAVLAVIYAVWRIERPSSVVAVTGLALLGSGAVGNAIDRVLFGAVTDLFDFRLINFAVFNVADAGITVGAIMVGAWVIFGGAEFATGGPDDEQ